MTSTASSFRTLIKRTKDEHDHLLALLGKEVERLHDEAGQLRQELAEGRRRASDPVFVTTLTEDPKAPPIPSEMVREPLGVPTMLDHEILVEATDRIPPAVQCDVVREFVGASEMDRPATNIDFTSTPVGVIPPVGPDDGDPFSFRPISSKSNASAKHKLTQHSSKTVSSFEKGMRAEKSNSSKPSIKNTVHSQRPSLAPCVETYSQWQCRHSLHMHSNSHINGKLKDQDIKTFPANRCDCGTCFIENDVFCRHCGVQRPVVMDKCTGCCKPLGEDAKFCTVCGRARHVGHMIATCDQVVEHGEGFKVRSCWVQDLSLTKGMSKGMTKELEQVMAMQTQRARSYWAENNRGASWLNFLVHHPVHPGRIAFDAFGMLLIAYDVFVLPLQTVFDFDETVLMRVLQYIGFCYWNINLVVSFFLAYIDRGVLVLEPKRTAMQFLKTWFTLDVLVLLPDWIEICVGDLDENDEAGFAARLLSFVRLLRMVRLARLVKLFAVGGRVCEVIKINSEVLNIFAHVLKSVAELLLTTHLIACAWYFCARSQKGNSATWIGFHGFEDDTWYHIYAVALHWSLTQFTPASMHVQPQNLTERTFTCFIVVFAMVTFSYILGSVSASMTELRRLTEDKSKALWSVRRFLRQHDVPLNLSLRVQQYLSNKIAANKKTLNLTHVPLLKLLSQQLRNELALARIQKYLQHHPLFEFLNERYRPFVAHFVAKSVREQHFAMDDDLFYQGEPASFMYFIAEGQLEYSMLQHEEVVTEFVNACERAWIGEGTLWMEAWLYLGCAIMTSDATMIEVDPASLEITRHSECHDLLEKYARSFASIAEHMDSDVHRSFPGDCRVTDFLVEEGAHLNRGHIPKFKTILKKLHVLDDGESQIQVVTGPNLHPDSSRISA